MPKWSRGEEVDRQCQDSVVKIMAFNDDNFTEAKTEECGLTPDATGVP